MNNADIKDPLFRNAVDAIDLGDSQILEMLIEQNPYLVKDRLDLPIEGYFANPYLLWFIADNPIRHEKLPQNIVDITRLLVEYIRKESPDTLREQLDYTLGLVNTGRIPRESGFQIALMDLLIDSGAIPGGGKGAIAHGNFEAARHLIKRGGKLSLSVAVSLDMKDELETLFSKAGEEEKTTALTAAAFLGKADMVSWLLKKGVSPNGYPTKNSGFHSHATPLHQAVYSGSLETVKLLTAAGARLDLQDKVYAGTPLGWAEYMIAEEATEENAWKYSEIVRHLAGLIS
jgi:peptide-methionine (S)-S-oxide reductase